jgi:molybdopterin synthase catalytic subunit
MRLTVRLFAVLRERAGQSKLELFDLPDGLNMGQLKRELAVRHPELGDLVHIAGVVGDSYVPDDQELAEGDAVALLPPVSGGAPEADYEAGVFELSSEPLNPGDLAARVSHSSCGAVVTFTGMTRDTNRGLDVVELDFEAFHEMAGPEMARIFSDCVASHELHPDPDAGKLRMLCAHRVGTVGVGEPSVVICVASPHRAEAFEAARFLIDTLKERLPVWKKESYGDGHHWIGDRS